MRKVEDLAREEIRKLKRCIHGGEVWDIALQTGRSVEDFVDFSSSVNPLGPSPKALTAAKEAFSRLAFYPDSNSTSLRETLASHYGVKKSNVIVGNGSTELIYLYAEVFLKQGDFAVVPSPSFGEYESAIRKAGGKLRFSPLTSEFKVDSESIKQKMKGTKLLFLCNPNNPTGMLMEHQSLIDAIETALAKDILVFLDEDFIEFVDDELEQSLISELGRFPNLFVLRTFTKFYGLTGLRVGFGFGDPELIDVLCKIKMPWSVNSLGQAAAAAALADEAHNNKTRAVVRSERKFLLKGLASLKGFKVYPSDANYIFLNVKSSGFSAGQLRERMLNRGILIRDCESFHGLDEFFIRVAVRTRSENTRLLATFHEVLADEA